MRPIAVQQLTGLEQARADGGSGGRRGGPRYILTKPNQPITLPYHHHIILSIIPYYHIIPAYIVPEPPPTSSTSTIDYCYRFSHFHLHIICVLSGSGFPSGFFCLSTNYQLHFLCNFIFFFVVFLFLVFCGLERMHPWTQGRTGLERNVGPHWIGWCSCVCSTAQQPFDASRAVSSPDTWRLWRVCNGCA
ncbi:hypothetical protein EDC01DRAFT_642762 [Geopyxis carbonaria]|nr:hypothetical protein EDC01DRAFT_642762 [Geopyxis carbonaria]